MPVFVWWLLLLLLLLLLSFCLSFSFSFLSLDILNIFVEVLLFFCCFLCWFGMVLGGVFGVYGVLVRGVGGGGGLCWMFLGFFFFLSKNKDWNIEYVSCLPTLSIASVNRRRHLICFFFFSSFFLNFVFCFLSEI